MRVLYILSGTNQFAGSTKSFLNMMVGLKEKNVIPFVVVPDQLGIYEELKKQNIKVKSIPYRKSVYPPYSTLKDLFLFLPRLVARIYINYIAVLKLELIALNFKPEIVHTNVSVINIGYNLAKKIRIPHVWHIREYGDLDFGYHYYPSKKSFLSKLNKENSYTICITKDIMKYFSLSINKYNKVVYNGIFSENYIKNNVEKSDYLLWAGRIEPAKGTLDIILAYRDLLQNKPQLTTQLWIAGEISNNEYYKKIKSLVENFGLEKYIQFLGKREDISDLMQKAIALIVTSPNEGFGRITAEAMFNGCLVIGKNTAGTKEQFDNGRELTKGDIGLKYSSVEELIYKLEEVLIKKNVNYSQLVFNSQLTVKTYYTIEQNVEGVYKFYQEILGFMQNKL